MLLPPEIKLHVTRYLDPLSSINFGITCKEHWKLCQPLFKKHARRFAEAPVVTAYNVLDVLRDTVHDPSKGWYIREISFRDRWDDPFTTPIEDAEQLQSAARQLASLYSNRDVGLDGYCIFAEIETGLATGRPDSAAAVLIHYLPNLRTLRLTIGRSGNVFELLLEQIGVEYTDAAKRRSLPLQQLRTASLAHSDTEGSIPPDWVLPFLRLPTLRIFAASMMGGDFRRESSVSAGRFLPDPQSGLEEFFFISSQFDSSALEYLLSCTTTLKRFTYQAGGCCTSESSYDAKQVIEALAEHTQHSLECLVMGHFMYTEEEALAQRFHYEDEEGPTEADLSMFTRLKSLSANWAMLWPDLSAQLVTARNDKPCSQGNAIMPCTYLDIRDILPASLENLHLGGVFDSEEWEGVTGPLAVMNDMKPNLTLDKIRVDGRVQENTNRSGRDIVAIGGWDAVEKVMVFGGADKLWLRLAWAPSKLFEGHG